MPLEVQLQARDGNVLDRTGEVAGAREVSFPSFADSASPLLKYIDPYGKTYFNSLQMEGLLPALKAVRKRCRDDGQIALLDQLIRLAEDCARRPHSLLVFIGD